MITFKTNRLVLVAAAIVCLGSAVTLDAQVNYESYNGFQCDPVPRLPDKEIHPSLWFNADGAAAIRAKKGQDEEAAALWKKVSESQFLTMELMAIPKATDEKKPVHKYYGHMSQAAKYSGFMIWICLLYTSDAADE